MISTETQTAPAEEQAPGIFERMDGYDHEQVVFCHDEATGLNAIIAVHNTVLGPALGGTRMWAYKEEGEAIYDVLRLSRGMTYKAAISGLNLGGGKAVILADPYKDKTEALWRRYGRFVESLGGKYITAEDVGTSPRDIEYIAMETDHVAGKPAHLGGGGDPSPVTAYGTYLGMKAAAREAWGSDDLATKKIVIQGVGHVGQYLVRHLVKENAIVYISDINESRVNDTMKEYGVQAVDTDALYDIDMDIYSPCALGATINDNTIDRIKCEIVAGAANNQLKDEKKHGEMLRDKGILYAPDFLINAGGLINCYSELEGYNEQRAYALAETIYDRTLEIFRRAQQKDITTHVAAVEMAKERLDAMAKLQARL